MAAVVTKIEADAYDRMLDAACALAEMIAESRIAILEADLEELTIFLARHGPAVCAILKGLSRVP